RPGTSGDPGVDQGRDQTEEAAPPLGSETATTGESSAHDCRHHSVGERGATRRRVREVTRAVSGSPANTKGGETPNPWPGVPAGGIAGSILPRRVRRQHTGLPTRTSTRIHRAGLPL